MARDFSPAGLVQLPRMNAEGCSAVGTKCVTVGRATKGLRGDVRDTLDELAESNDALRAALRARLRNASATGEDTQVADVVIDRAWGSFHSWLDGWRGCRYTKDPEAVAALFAQVFSDGRSFLLLPYEQEWTASNTRLELLAQSETRALVHKLGGEPFLRDLQDAHKEYGRVLGITVATPPSPSSTDDDPAVREAYEQSLAALRSYVLAVSHTTSRMKSGGAELAARLLAPVNDWAPPTGKATQTAGEPVPAPTPPDPKK